MTSEEIGEAIDQFRGESIRDAWEKWAPSAADWILKQLPNSGIKIDRLIEEICEENPKKLSELDNVWIGDIYPDNCKDVIQVIVVGPGGGGS